jgi:hypothetical protein
MSNRPPLFFAGPVVTHPDGERHRQIYASRELIDAGERLMREMRARQDAEERLASENRRILGVFRWRLHLDRLLSFLIRKVG